MSDDTTTTPERDYEAANKAWCSSVRYAALQLWTVVLAHAAQPPLSAEYLDRQLPAQLRAALYDATDPDDGVIANGEIARDLLAALRDTLKSSGWDHATQAAAIDNALSALTLAVAALDAEGDCATLVAVRAKLEAP